MRTRHDGDCTIYASLINCNPTDGICTCGYGFELVRQGDWSQMYSNERTDSIAEEAKQVMEDSQSDPQEPIEKIKHDNDCLIFAEVGEQCTNFNGTCTCGFGVQLQKAGDTSQLASAALLHRLQEDPVFLFQNRMLIMAKIKEGVKQSREWLKNSRQDKEDTKKLRDNIDNMMSVLDKNRKFLCVECRTKMGIFIEEGEDQEGESYPEPWKHATIHLNPETGEMHSDGDHSVREYFEKRLAIIERLPKTLDGVPFIDRDLLWFIFYDVIVSVRVKSGVCYVGWSPLFKGKASRYTLKAPYKIDGTEGYSSYEAAKSAKGLM